MKKLLSILAIFTLTLGTFAQQTLPSRDGAAQIENGSGTLKFSVDTSGVGTITPSGTDLVIAGTLKPSTVLGTAYGGTGAATVTGTGIGVLSSGATVTNLTITSGTFAGTTASASTSLTVGGGAAMLKFLSAAATLDFGSVATNTTADLTITVTGAGTNSVVIPGLPAGSDTNFVFNMFVSATNTVTVRAANISTGAVDPAAGSFRATVIQY